MTPIAAPALLAEADRVLSAPAPQTISRDWVDVLAHIVSACYSVTAPEIEPTAVRAIRQTAMRPIVVLEFPTIEAARLWRSYFGAEEQPLVVNDRGVDYLAIGDWSGWGWRVHLAAFELRATGSAVAL